MSKLCEYCGAELNGTEKACPKCGAPTNNVEQTKVNNITETVNSTVSNDQTAQNGNQKKRGNAVKIVIAVLVLAVVAGVTVLLMNLFGNSYNKTIKYFCTAVEKADEKTWLKMYPDFMVKDMDDDDKESLEEGLESAKESFEEQYGKNYKVSFKVTNKEKMDKEELEEGQEAFEEEYGKGKKTKVTAGYTLTGDLTIKGKEDSETFEDLEIIVVKIGGKWCMMQDPLSAMMVSSFKGLSE